MSQDLGRLPRQTRLSAGYWNGVASVEIFAQIARL